MRLNRALALAGATAATVFAACKEPPFAPRWDAPWYMPLSTQSIALDSMVPPSPLNVIPPNTPLPDSFPAQQQDVSGVLETVFKNIVTDPARCTSPVNAALSCDLLKLKVAKTTLVAVTDTLFVASSLGGLNAVTPGTIVFPISLAAAATAATDSVYLTPASVLMLQQAGETSSPLFVQLRGTVDNPGPGNVTITAADTIGVNLSATITIAVSRK
jgi:hypothetical protein